MPILKMNIRESFLKTAIIFFFLISFLFLNGCQSYLVNYSNAQKHFDSASQIQMAQVFEPVLGVDAENAVLSSQKIQTNYALALKMISQIIKDNKEDLTTDDLLGNAYTIKALSEWKLGKTDDALKTQKLAMTNSDQIYPRDKALMTALPGLIKADQANAMLLSNGKYEDIKGLIVGNYGAFKDFDNAMSLLDPNHPVSLYLIMSKLAAIRIVQVGTGTLEKEAAKKERKKLKDEYISHLFDTFEKKVKKMGFDKNPSGQHLIHYWNFLLGIG